MIEHPILSEHPRIVEHRARVAEIRKAQEALNLRIRDRQEKYRRDLADWRQARNRALISGDEIPEEPTEPPSAQAEIVDLMEESRDLSRQETAIVGEIGDELRQAALAREVELLDEAGPLVERLDGITAELVELLSVLNRVDRSRATRDPSAPTKVDTRSLVAAVSRSETILRPARRTRVLVGPS